MTIAQNFIATTVLGAVLFFGLGYMVARHLRHKRTALLISTLHLAAAKAKAENATLGLAHVVGLIEQMDRTPEFIVLFSHVMRVAIFEEAPPDDPH